MPAYLAALSTWELEALAARGALAAIPVGSVEQHCNAPLGSDSLIAEALARRACAGLERAEGVPCVLAPTLYYGYSPEWEGSPGTVSLPATVFLGLVESVLEGLAGAGFRRIALVNGHGGNSGLLEAAARAVARRRPGVAVGVIEYWRLLGERLGHCDRLEESILSSILGRRVECSCSARALHPGSVRAALLPGPTRGVGLDLGASPRSLEEASEAVARGMRALLELEEGVVVL